MTEYRSIVEIRRRSMYIENDGLNPEELRSVIEQVERRMAQIEEREKLMDTSKIATIAAVEIAIELHKLKKP